MSRVVVAGYVVRGPLGGSVWHHLQYLLGLRRLGHDVWFVEDSDDYPSCYDPARDEMVADPTYGLRFAADVFGSSGFGDRWAYHDAHTGRWLGAGATGVLDACRAAELLLDLSGVNPLRPWLAAIPKRALVDTDPAFTQVRHLTDASARATAEGHTSFFTFGENLPAGRSTIPDDGFDWQATRQPVVLSAWPPAGDTARRPFTTVMVWDPYPARRYGGRTYGTKADSFAPYLDLPSSTGCGFELALGGPNAPRRTLEEHGWRVVDPLEPTRTPQSFQAYLAESTAEWSVAKEAYVSTRSGWFSERSTSYLASGRPVVVQETGFSDVLPTGEGIVPFSSADEAAAAVAEVERRYERHCRAARRLVAEHFGSDRVLAELLERALA